MTDILNKLASVHELQAMNLAPAPGRGNASLVGMNRSTLKQAQADWSFRQEMISDGFDSSQEEALWVAHNNKHYKNGRSSRNSNTSNDNDTIVTNTEVRVINCKHCQKWEQTKPHPVHFPVKNARGTKMQQYRFANMCKKMKLQDIEKEEFKKGKESKWPKHKAAMEESNKRQIGGHDDNEGWTLVGGRRSVDKNKTTNEFYSTLPNQYVILSDTHVPSKTTTNIARTTPIEIPHTQHAYTMSDICSTKEEKQKHIIVQQEN